MFKKTKTLESTLFESPSNLMRGRALKQYDDPKEWLNRFYDDVTNNIDEDKFKPLYKEGNMLRKKYEATPKTELDRRNNVEAAIFQIIYHTRNDKTRYRGLAKHVMWACSRCMWMNFIRLMIFQATACQRTLLGLF